METRSKPYTVYVQGPDLDARFVLQDEADLAVLELILTKIRTKVLRPVDPLEIGTESTE